MPNSTELYECRLNADRREIRTLTLKRAEAHEPIQCALNTVSLNDRPTYIALSYVWGDAQVKVPIEVSGTDFQATRNLALALRYIRKSNQDQTLWVDAVCINQSDVEERNQQVSIMGTLYSEAEEVIIWLGEADRFTEELVHIVNQRSVPSPPTAGMKDYEVLCMEYATQISRFSNLFEVIAMRPWWERVWTVQECILPRSDPRFQCGSWTFLWTNFFETFFDVYQKFSRVNAFEFELHPSVREVREYLGELADPLGDPQRVQALSMLGSVRQHFAAFSSIPLPSCIVPCLGRLATVPHDYIYGFLGLTTEEERQAIKIDYRQQHWDIYRDFVDLLLSNGRDDDLLLLTQISFKKDSLEYPSWIPDFTAQRDMTRYTGKYLASKTCFRSLEEVWWSDDGDILMLQGVLIDVIDIVHPINDRSERFVNHLSDLTDLCQGLAKSTGCTGGYPPEAVVEASRNEHIRRLFTASASGGPEWQVDDTYLDTCWDGLFHPDQNKRLDVKSLRTSLAREAREELGGLSITTVTSHIVSRSLIACMGRALTVTQAGILGICVPNAHQGDIVVCLYGLHMPLILRPGKDYYTIVGGVYLSGLMDWVILGDCYEKGLLQEATFRIR